MQGTSAIEQIFDAIRLVQNDLSQPTLSNFQQLHAEFLHLLRATELATDYHPEPKETRSSILALRELQNGMDQLLKRCETHVRSNDFDFRSNIAYHLSTVSRKELHAERAEKLRYQKYCRQAEKKLQRLVDAINQVRVLSSIVVPNQSIIFCLSENKHLVHYDCQGKPVRMTLRGLIH